MTQAALRLDHGPIEHAVIDIIEDLVQDWGLDLPERIHSGMLLGEQLDFASVDIIQLCVAIEQHFDRKLGFQELLLVDGSYVEDLSIAEVAEFVARRLRRSVRGVP